MRHLLRRQRNARVLMGEVTAVDPARKVVMLDAGPIAYDYLVLATGATHGYFGRDEWAVHAPGLKTLDDATAIRRRLLLAFERAEMASESGGERAAPDDRRSSAAARPASSSPAPSPSSRGARWPATSA